MAGFQCRLHQRAPHPSAAVLRRDDHIVDVSPHSRERGHEPDDETADELVVRQPGRKHVDVAVGEQALDDLAVRDWRGRAQLADEALQGRKVRGDLAVWRAAHGIHPDDRCLAGPPPDHDREGAYHRHLTRTINAGYGDALKAWETRIIRYVDKHDAHTTALAKRLDDLRRRGIDAVLMLDLAAARKPLPTDHPTSALGYRVGELVTPKRHRRASTMEPLTRAPQQPSGPALGL